MTTTIYLIRHGNIECSDRVPGRMSGMHLSDSGREQALFLLSFFKHRSLNFIYSSPLERTIETAKPLAKEKGVDLISEDSFTEIDFGKWTGMTFNELEKDNKWKQFHFFRNGCQIPEGELMIDVQHRMISKIDILKTRHQGQSIAIFSHNDPIKSVIAFYLGISLDLFLRINIDTGSISVITFERDDVQVNMINQSSKIQV